MRALAGRAVVPLLLGLAGLLLAGGAALPQLVQPTAAVAPVVAAPSRAPAAAAAVPALPAPVAVTTQPSPFAVPQPPRPGPVVFPAPVGTPLPETPPTAGCGGYGNPRRIVPGVATGPGSATLTWQADGHGEVTGYRVQAVSQQLVPGPQPEPVRATAAQPAGCAPVSVTVSGLTSGEAYVFWLEEQVDDPLYGTTRLVQVGTTGAVVVP
jgi:hypothetical protein